MLSNLSKPIGTAFQKLVWDEIEKIPYGEVRTYKDIAIAIGNPKASRAVANACGKNPTPIIRPCHRVICTNGDIGGYSAPGGAIEKKRLIDSEKN